VVNPFRASMVLGTPGSGKYYRPVENYNKKPTEQDVAFLTPSELQQQNNQKADRVLAMIERRKQLEKLRRSSKQRQRDF